MDRVKKESIWLNALNSADSTILHATFKEIYLESLRDKKSAWDEKLVKKLQDLILHDRKKLSKACLEIGCKALCQVCVPGREDFNLKAFCRDSRLAVHLVNGALTTDYKKMILLTDLQEIVVKVAESCSRDQSIWIIWALKSLVNFCKLHPKEEYDYQALSGIFWMNLTSSVAGVREHNLTLLKFIVQNCQEWGTFIFQEVLCRWPWINPYKYYILGVVLENLDSFPENFDEKLFLQGLSTSLKHRNLLSPGQFLFKSVVKEKKIFVADLAGDILLNGSLLEMDNFINHWLSVYPDIDELYGEISLPPLDTIPLWRCILIRSAFRNQMDNDDFTGIIRNIKELDTVVREHFYEIVISRVASKDTTSDDIYCLGTILLFHSEEENTRLRQYILKRFPAVLDHITRKNFNQSDFLPCFTSLFDIILRIVAYGIDRYHPSYQRCIYSLRILEMMLKFLSGQKKHQMTKTFNPEASLRLKRFISSENFNSNGASQALIHLLHSSFDDIRDLACEILKDFFFLPQTESYSPSELFENRLHGANIERADCMHMLARILVTWDRYMVKVTEQVLESKWGKFQKDPYASIQGNDHIFGIINSLTEFINTELIDIEKILEKISQITEVILDYLNEAGEPDEPPSFEVMEVSLQLLIDKSKAKPRVNYKESDTQARKLILLSLWKTLRACGIFAATASKIFASRGDSTSLETCFHVSSSILQRCRHKGAIEAAGLSLGNTVKVITSLPYTQSMDDFLFRVLKDLILVEKNVSTTRRGAGYSIMLLNLVRNDVTDDRRFLHTTITILFQHLNPDNQGASGDSVENVPESVEGPEKDKKDNLEAVMLHYLCVLVKDSSLTEEILPYTPTILTVAFGKINSCEWTVRNGALQLCGALIPKIVGQKTHFQVDEDWQPVKVSIDDVRIKFGEINNFLLDSLRNYTKDSTTILITILELISRMGFWWTETYSMDNILTIRSALWNLLSHPCHHIRLLSAKSFASLHEFTEIPGILLNLVKIVPQIVPPNHLHGILLTMDAMVKKFKAESHFIPTPLSLESTKSTIEHLWKDLPDRISAKFIRIYLKKFLESIESSLADKVQGREY
ncbi:hypothetical protein DMENIID0001_010360 [Sergentomyia squamirostris]